MASSASSSLTFLPEASISSSSEISRLGTRNFSASTRVGRPRWSDLITKASLSSPMPAAAEEWWRRPKAAAPFSSATSVAPALDFFVDRPFELHNGLPVVEPLKHQENLFQDRGKPPGTPVYVMLPLDSVNPSSNQVNRRRAMDASFQALKSAGVEGVMMDVWWGIVQKDGPHSYNWSGYRELMEMARKHGLKVQAVMSFHQCGGNVGDSAHIPLPPWVVEEIHKNPDMVYTDRYGNRNYEYLSLGCDDLPVLNGRTPLQAYADFMRNFRDEFQEFLGDVISEIQVGMGPAGELRYPGYPERDGIWRFPGVGEFQCYDKYLLASLKASAAGIGKPRWGCPPSDAGSYQQWPEDSTFFKREGGWNTEYGKFFLEWYSGMLIEHGEKVLTAAEGVFRGRPVRLSGKVAGIHWHYGTRSHAPELTAGYYNTRFRDGYLPIAQMFGRHGVTFNFTCFEMKDVEQPAEAQCSPEGLLKQVTLATRKVGVPLAGENALPRYDEDAYHQIAMMSRLEVDGEQSLEPMCTFTFLRMSQSLFHPENWRRFVQFVKQMADGNAGVHEHERKASELYVVTKPLIQEAAAALV